MAGNMESVFCHFLFLEKSMMRFKKDILLVQDFSERSEKAMKKKYMAGACCILCMAFLAAGCGSGKPPEENENTEDVQQEEQDESTADEEPEYDENGNLIEKEPQREDKNILAADAETMITGFVAVMENGKITESGIWMTEEEVGMIAQKYADFKYTYEKGSLKKSEAAYIACFYDINGDAVGAMYLTENADMCYNNKYRISDAGMRGLFADAVGKIEEDSVLSFDNSSVDGTVDKNTTDGNSAEQDKNSQGETQTPNAVIEISRKTFAETEGIDEQMAQVLAQSAYNLGIAAVKQAAVEANTIVFTDVNDIQYTLSIVDERISSVYNETEGTYLYQQNG